MMNAIGDRKERLAEAISLLPDFLRRANTTFVNLRAALDDLDPLVSASKPAARELRPFLAILRQAAADAVPTVRDLDAIVARPGPTTTWSSSRASSPRCRAGRGGARAARTAAPGSEDPDDLEVAADDDFSQGAFGESVCALSNGNPTLAFFRAYTPELVGWFDDFGHSGSVDAASGIGRVATLFNAFSVSGPAGTPDFTDPLSAGELAAALTTGQTRRCPGGNERPINDVDPSDDSVPFTDGGALTDGVAGDCDPSQVLPGP